MGSQNTLNPTPPPPPAGSMAVSYMNSETEWVSTSNALISGMVWLSGAHADGELEVSGSSMWGHHQVNVGCYSAASPTT